MQDTERSHGEPRFVGYTGHLVIDERGQRIGHITDVVYSDPTTELVADPLAAPTPSWLVVDPGVLRAAHYVPVAGSYRTADGDVVVPWDRDWVRSALKARGDHLLSSAELHDLARHYAVVV